VNIAIRTVAFGVLCLASVQAHAQQTVTVDWDTHTVTSAPISVSGTTAVTVEVDNINDYLYSYNGMIVVSGSQTPASLIPAAPPAPGPCTDASVEAKFASINEKRIDPMAGLASDATPASISLGAFLVEYKKARAFMDLLTDQALSGCSQTNLDFTTFWKSNSAAFLKQDSSPHKLLFTASLEPLTNYQIKVSEKYNGVLTALTCDPTSKSTGGCAIEYDPTNDILSNSQGFLVTTLPAYSFARANVPGSTDSVLQVTTTKPARVAVAAVFNVRIPFPYLERRSANYRTALTFGPAYQLDAPDQTANRLGFFFGLSLLMYKHFVLTPGVHLAQYSQYPAGFTHDGQDIPASFTGPLTSTSKNTLKFGVLLSFKDWSIVKTTSQGNVTAPK
jgi:hypothetical protein